MSGFRLGAFSVFLLLSISNLVDASETPVLEGKNESRFINLRVEPMAVLFGIYGLRADFTVAKALDLGISFDWFSSEASGRTVVARQYGVFGTYYLGNHEGYDSFFVRPAVEYISVSTTFATQVATAPNSAIGATFGYRWIWGAGLNVDIGVGIVYRHVPALSAPGAAEEISEIQPEMDWSIGWQF